MNSRTIEKNITTQIEKDEKNVEVEVNAQVSTEKEPHEAMVPKRLTKVVATRVVSEW